MKYSIVTAITTKDYNNYYKIHQKWDTMYIWCHEDGELVT